MSLKLKYFLFIGSLHLVLIFLAYQLLQEQKIYFILSEAIILASIYFSFQLYRSFIRPLELMQSGKDAILAKDFTIKYTKTGFPEMDNLIDIYNSMIDKLREERTLINEQGYFILTLIETSPFGIIVLDYDDNISNINSSALSIFQIDSSEKEQLIWHPLLQKIQTLAFGESQIIQNTDSRKFKCQINEIIHLGFKRKFIIIDDLSSEIIETEKAAFGKIIRVMAHEVNNSVGAINSILDSVIDEGLNVEKDADLIDGLEMVKGRNTGLSKFVANYASILRVPKPNIKPINLFEFVDRIYQLMSVEIGKQNIQFLNQIPSDFQIKGDAILLEQCFINVLKNAQEAIKGNGCIKVHATTNQIIFSDNGAGISSENQAKIFSPFFSTKQDGQGVGLMLIREILDKHQFTCSLQRNGDFTEFVIQV